ncbi:hypothetical protein [Brevibacillus sp. SYP-B805]|nr:hypothetical protein [Brevibacillus sp. SYP-B805]
MKKLLSAMLFSALLFTLAIAPVTFAAQNENASVVINSPDPEW